MAFMKVVGMGSGLITLPIILGVLIAFHTCVFSQDTVQTPNAVKLAGLKFHVGSILIHSRELRPIEDSYPLGVELDLAWHKISQKAWES